MRRIAIILSSLSGGGAEKVGLNLAKEFSELRFKVDVICLLDKNPFEEKLPKNINLVQLKSKRFRSAILPLCRHLKKESYDLVVSSLRATNIIAGLAAYFIRIPILIFREANTIHGIHSGPKLKAWLFLILMKLSYKKASRVICNSFDTKKSLESARVVDPSKLVVIHNPVLPSNFEYLAEEKTTEPWLEDRNLEVVLSVGRLHRQKNFSSLIEAFSFVHAERPTTRLLIIGQGELEAELRSKIHALGLKAFVKIIPRTNNVFAFMKNSKVFALASEWEGFGNVLVEALSTGTSVVSTNCPGGPKEILDHGSFGDLVAPNKPRELAERILFRLEQPFEQKAIKERALQFSSNRVAREYIAKTLGSPTTDAPA